MLEIQGVTNLPVCMLYNMNNASRSSLILVLVAGIKRKHRCNQCPQCLADDCGTCKFCLDKPKFGGKGSKKQCCIKRRCTVDLTMQSQYNRNLLYTPQQRRYFYFYTSIVYFHEKKNITANLQKPSSGKAQVLAPVPLTTSSS